MPGGRCSNCIAFDSECTHVTPKVCLPSFAGCRNYRFLILFKETWNISQVSSVNIRSHEALSDSCSSKPSPRTINAQDISDDSPPVGGSRLAATDSLIQSILSSSSYDGFNDIPTVRRALARLAQHALSLEQELATLKESSNGKDDDPDNEAVSKTSVISTVSTSISTNDGDDLTLSENLKRLTIGAWHDRFFGTSSTLMLIKTAMEMQRASNGGKASGSPDFSENLRPAFWNAHPVSVFQQVYLAGCLRCLKWEYVPSEHPSPQYFPDSDLLMHLIQLFFDNVNIHAPLLHRPTFERFVRDNLHLNDHLFGASVLAVCAVASRYSNDARVILEGTDSLYSSGWQWFRQIKPFQRPISQVPSIYELQTYLVCFISAH